MNKPNCANCGFTAIAHEQPAGRCPYKQTLNVHNCIEYHYAENGKYYEPDLRCKNCGKRLSKHTPFERYCNLSQKSFARYEPLEITTDNYTVIQNKIKTIAKTYYLAAERLQIAFLYYFKEGRGNCDFVVMELLNYYRGNVNDALKAVQIIKILFEQSDAKKLPLINLVIEKLIIYKYNNE